MAKIEPLSCPKCKAKPRRLIINGINTICCSNNPGVYVWKENVKPCMCDIIGIGNSISKVIKNWNRQVRKISK